VRFTRPVHLDRKHRVLVMVLPDALPVASEDVPDGWNHLSIDQPYRYLPSPS
jgi:hypothetical protein